MNDTSMQELKTDGRRYAEEILSYRSPMSDPFEFVEYLDDVSIDNIAESLVDVPQGHGGGLCMNMADLDSFNAIQISIKDVQIVENEAVVGGGASLHFSALFWDRGQQQHCFTGLTESSITCQRFYLSNVTIQRNKAYYIGGLFTTHPENILVTCDLDHPDLEDTFERIYSTRLDSNGSIDSVNDLKCLRISDNQITDGASIQAVDVGTSIRFLRIDGLTNASLKTVASGDVLERDCKAPCNATVEAIIEDAFHQRIARGIADADLEVTIASDHVAGDIRYASMEGKAIIDNTKADGIDIRSNLTIFVDADRKIQTQTIFFSTRACYPGELEKDNRCIPCVPETYGFTPEASKCRSCEDNAVCRGGAVLVPMDTYWHSTPYSPLFYRCVYPNACACEGRVERLIEYYNNPIRMENDLKALEDYSKGQGPKPIFPDYPQCEAGHEGILCGSCMENYGHSISGSCSACPSVRPRASFLVFCAIFITFIVIGTNCVVTLLSTRARIKLVQNEMQHQAAIDRPRTLQRAGPHIENRNTIRTILSIPGTLTGDSSIASEFQSRTILSQQLVAAVQLTETLKILVNYLQVTSSALRLPVGWKSLLDGFLSFEAVIVGVTGEAFSVPFECNFQQDGHVPRSILAIWTRLLIPVVVLTALISIYTILWLISHSKMQKACQESRRSLARRLITGVIIIVIVTVYFSYIDNMREFLRIINCIKVDAHVSLMENHPYSSHAIDRGHRYWAEDTHLICFEGKHTATGIAGIFGLFLSFLVIVFIIAWLPMNKKKTERTEFVARYWFIYQAYKKEWYTLPWEAMILIRKTIVAAVVVFAFQLGPGLQATLCVGTLIVAHVLQVSLRPFKVPSNHDNVPDYAGAAFRKFRLPRLAIKWVNLNNSLSLNALESLSLLASILVFYSATLLTRSTCSYFGKCVMCFVAFVFNVVYLWYMFYRMYCGFHVLVDLKLEMINPGFMAMNENHLGILHLLNKIVEVFRTTLRRYLTMKEEHQRRSCTIVEEETL